jgi:hypothetical protein
LAADFAVVFFSVSISFLFVQTEFLIAALANPPQRNVVVFGAPGADTSALSQQVCAQYRLLHVNTTDLLHKADFGGDGAKVKQVADALASGSAVPDALVAEVYSLFQCSSVHMFVCFSFFFLSVLQ